MQYAANTRNRRTRNHTVIRVHMYLVKMENPQNTRNVADAVRSMHKVHSVPL